MFCVFTWATYHTVLLYEEKIAPEYNLLGRTKPKYKDANYIRALTETL